jgi:hypothetical protein
MTANYSDSRSYRNANKSNLLKLEQLERSKPCTLQQLASNCLNIACPLRDNIAQV